MVSVIGSRASEISELKSKRGMTRFFVRVPRTEKPDADISTMSCQDLPHRHDEHGLPEEDEGRREWITAESHGHPKATV